MDTSDGELALEGSTLIFTAATVGKVIENPNYKSKHPLQLRSERNPSYRISRRISRVSGHQNRGQKIDLDLYEGHIISVVRLLIKNLACLAICSF